MKRFTSMLVQKFAVIRRMLLHVLCFSSLAAVALGWSFLERLGPMAVILPMVAAIGACVSEIDRFQEPRYAAKGGLRRETSR